MAAFEVVRDEPAPPPSRSSDAATDLLMLSLKSLGQRFVVALASLFCLTTVLTVFWVGMSIIREPTILQLVGFGMYATFILIVNWIARKA